MNGGFGENLKTLRKEAGVTQAALAEKLNVHLQTVSKWERGVSEPDFALLGELAGAVGVSLEKLVGAEEGGQLFTGRFSAAAFGKNLAALRKERGESQEQLAEALGTAAGAVSKWERGVICPDREQLLLLAAHAGVPASRIYYGIGERERTETPAQAVRRKKFTYLWAGLGVLACAALIVAAVLFSAAPAGERGAVYAVTIGEERYEVGEGDWFSPSAPAKEGYDFVRWQNGAGESVSVPCKIEEDTELIPVFEPSAYNIDYWLNGGSLPADAAYTFTVESGAVQLPQPHKQGAEFCGWYLAPDYTGEPAESIVCEAADVSVYAKWSSVVYTVRYELCGGAVSVQNPETVTADAAVPLSDPLREGYIFLGWFSEPEGGERYTEAGGKNACNLTLYARWQASGGMFSVRYETCGGTPAGENPQQVGAGERHALYGAEKAGYDFTGWNSEQDGSGTWYAELYGVSSDLVLYVVYSPKQYTLVYKLGGGTYYEGENPNTVTFGEEVLLNPVAKAGHTFLGWFDAETGGSEVEAIDTENILRLHTLYARFAPNEYTVVLDGAGGTFAYGGQRHEEYSLVLLYGDEAALPDCTLAGYLFLGWYDESGSCVTLIDEANIGDYTLTARYQSTEDTYTVLYELQGGTQNAKNPDEVVWGQVVYLSDPVRSGWRFLGWNDREDGSGTWYECTPEGRSTDLTLYAIWQEITVSGSSEEFTYEKGQASVTVTGYTGAFGNEVDLVIPSYIDGLPVTAVEGSFCSSGLQTDGHLHSLTIPETAVRLGEWVFARLKVNSPVTIPKSVKYIGTRAFSGASMPALLFEEGSALTEVGEEALASISLKEVLCLPQGVTALGERAFDLAMLPGIVLPEKLAYISAGALNCWGGTANRNLFRVYIPASVRTIEPGAFGVSGQFTVVYHSFGEDVLAGFHEGWAKNASRVVFVDEAAAGVTLKNGDETEYVGGHAIALPQLQKEGYTFLGWQDGQGCVAEPLYIPLTGGTVLHAVFELQSASDGRSASSPFVAEPGQEYEIFLPQFSSFYFTIEAEAERLLFTFKDLSHAGFEEFSAFTLRCRALSGGAAVGSGSALAHRYGEVYELTQELGEFYPFLVKLRVDVLPA